MASLESTAAPLPSRPRRLEWAALAAILLLAFVLRAVAPGPVELEFDEAGQLDGFSLPSEQWLEGDVLRQTLHIQLAPDAVPGTYELVVGLYSGVTGERALFESGTDHVSLGQVELVGD